MASGTGISTSAALLLRDRSFRYYRTRDLVRLVLLGPLDMLPFRPLVFCAQFEGMWDFLRGKKGWHKFERNRRDLVRAA